MVPTFLDVFGAKIQAVILYIHQQLALDPTAKFVAFTEYTFQFHLLGLALHLVNVQAEQVIDGASAYPPILAFKSDPNVRVLIMPFSKCAAGINLSEATHVLFLHPYAGRSESPWGRDKSTWFTSYSQFAPPPTAHVTMLNEERKQVWGEWERRCVEMVAMGKETHRHSPVRIARFAIQHSIEERFGWDSWSQV
ncbi:hypothetical protein BCR44DRAFT_1486105 [Catenaria anguillulae PL171]|uniref:Helicase C-terminal domain-containing protein n=1 Tax=Catenaria anguillulae PL171 TaxID=765915 RepID=A0A1Y2HM61_9FUNG|nr:hypothetical protein BCR44DRAFT_1486105 [Catenaria anguillulae PL171]